MNQSRTEYRHALAGFMNVLQRAGLLVSYEGDANLAIEHLSFDTRDLRERTLFFCKGVRFKAEYLTEAAKNGAVAYVSETRYPDVVLPCLLVSDIRSAMSAAALYHYGYPAERMTTVGITGTKGKTTVSFFIKAALDKWLLAQGKVRSALLSTVATFIGEDKISSRITTPEAIELQQRLCLAADRGTEYLTMEVSSQGLKYGRVTGVSYDIGCFLNIGYDHISPVEHPDYDDYFYSKLRLFDQVKHGILNLDTDRCQEVLDYVAGRVPLLTFSATKREADIYAYNIRKEGDRILFSVHTSAFDREFVLTTPGFFNVDNALAAIAVLTLIGVPVEYMVAAIAETKVEGRMELHRSEDGRLNAIVDFAHNVMSYEALAKSAKREFPDKKVVFIFGCPGNKAFNRRHDLGDTAGRYADYIYITEDDTASESFASISAQIAGFVEATGCPYEIIEDRETAIRTALAERGTESVLLIAGKGDETNQRTADGYKDYITDAGAVEKYIAEYNAAVKAGV